MIQLDEVKRVEGEGKGKRAQLGGLRGKEFISAAELGKHTSKEEGIWVVVDGDVWE